MALGQGVLTARWGRVKVEEGEAYPVDKIYTSWHRTPRWVFWRPKWRKFVGQYPDAFTGGKVFMYATDEQLARQHLRNEFGPRQAWPDSIWGSADGY